MRRLVTWLVIGSATVALALAQSPPHQGEVLDVVSRWTVNEFGDQQIVSDVVVGLPNGDSVVVESEGGIVGDIELRVNGERQVRRGDLAMVVWHEERKQWKLKAGGFAYATTDLEWADSMSWFVDTKYSEIAADLAIRDLTYAATTWTTDTGVEFAMQYGGRLTDGTGVKAFDHQSTVMFRPTTDPNYPSALAYTYWWATGGRLVDVDIIGWSGKVNWVAMDAPCPGTNNGTWFMVDVFTHEFGHMLGLLHSSVTAATMYPSLSKCSIKARTLAADDIAGAQSLYPQGPPPPPEICNDGIDNDGDELIDEGCPTEICGNGIDDDSDGQVDEGCPPPPTSPTLTASTWIGSGGAHMVDLVWSGVVATGVDVWQNGVKILSNVANDGDATRNLGTATGSFVYQVCPRLSATGCTNTATVTF